MSIMPSPWRHGHLPSIEHRLGRENNILYLNDKYDMIYEIDLTSRLKWKRPDICKDCMGKGTGIVSYTWNSVSWMECHNCNGTGKGYGYW